MTKRITLSRSLLAAAALLAAGGAQAAVATWTDWTSISGTAATGIMGGITVTVSATSGVIDGPSQTGCGTNFWTEPNPANPAYTGGSLSNAPTPCDQVALNSPVSISVSFSSAVDNLYMALLSVGRPGIEVTYDFDTAFVLDSEGEGAFGDGTFTIGAGDTLAMREMHGVLAFGGPISSLSFSTTPDEFWHAFTFGQVVALVPEPGSLALALGALSLMGSLPLRRRSR